MEFLYISLSELILFIGNARYRNINPGCEGGIARTHHSPSENFPLLSYPLLLMPKILSQALVIKTHEISKWTVLVALRIRVLSSQVHFNSGTSDYINKKREPWWRVSLPPWLISPSRSIHEQRWEHYFKQTLTAPLWPYLHCLSQNLPEDESSTQVLIQFTEVDWPDASLTSRLLAEHNLYKDPDNWSGGGQGRIQKMVTGHGLAEKSIAVATKKTSRLSSQDPFPWLISFLVFLALKMYGIYFIALQYFAIPISLICLLKERFYIISNT